MDQSKLDQSATNAAWKDVSSTHIDKIQPYLNSIVNDPSKFMTTVNKSKIIYNLKNTEVEELKYIINLHFSNINDSLEKDLIKLKFIKKNKSKKKNIKKKGLTKEEIILKNQLKQFKLNKFVFDISNNLISFNQNNTNVCDLIMLCKKLNKYKLINTANTLLEHYGGNHTNDLDQILSNLHLWKQQQSNDNFELTKCQKSIVQFILQYCKSPEISKTLLEMSNTGSGKTVGLIIAIGILWKHLLYHQCVSHSFITRNSRRHSVKFPTKIIIAILPSSVLSFVQAALTGLKVPWAYVTSTSTAILDEFNPDAVMNYANVSRRVFTHFCEGGSTAPAVYLTTETPTPKNAIFNCIKAAYKTVFSVIKKYSMPTNLEFENYLSYNCTNDSLFNRKEGSQYCQYDPNSICAIIGDDMETVESFNEINDILSANILRIITTATPTGLSQTLSTKTIHERLPNNTIIPDPQDEVRNSGGIKLIGAHDNINILHLAYIQLFKHYDKDDIYSKYKWRIIFESFIHGIFERKYIIPLLYSICSKFKPESKNYIMNRFLFFQTKLELTIDSIACHIMRQFCNILQTDNAAELITIITDIPYHNNNLFEIDNLQSKLIHTNKRGITLFSPKFSGDCSTDDPLIQLLAGDEELIYKKLSQYETEFNKYTDEKERIQKQFASFDSSNGASKLEMTRMSTDQMESITEPLFPLIHQLFSIDYLQQLDCIDPLKYATKLPIDSSQIKTAIKTNDVRLAQGVLSIDPINSKKLENALKNYTEGTPDNIRCVQFKTDAFSTRQLVLGANPPSKLNIIIANYDLRIEYPYTYISDGITEQQFPTSSVTNLLIQICGRIGRGINADANNYIFTTNSVANVLISTTPKTMLFNEYTNLCISLNKIQALMRGFLIRK